MKFALPLALIGLILFFAWPTEKSKRGYALIMSLNEKTEEAEHVHSQERLGIRKDLYVKEKGKETHTRLTSAASTLILEDQGGIPELVEVFPKFHLMMQEDTTPKGQVVRDVLATEGMFYYIQERITAKKALIARYTLPGDQLPEKITGEKPIFKGVAGALEVDFSEGMKFKAKQVKATLFGEES